MDKTYKHSCRLNLSFKSNSEAASFAKSIDIRDIRNRTDIQLSIKNNHIIFNIKSVDVVALRAIINSILRIASTVETLTVHLNQSNKNIDKTKKTERPKPNS